MTAAVRRVTVVGSSGLVGRQLVDLLRAADHDVVEVSRESGVDVITGDGVAEALDGASVVVDVINSPSPDDSSEAFFVQESANLGAAARRAGVGHYVVLSIVGSGALAPHSGYMRGKVAQELAAAGSGVPWTVVRSTQFHELTQSITESQIHGGAVHAPAASVQPIASAELAAILAQVAAGEPRNTCLEVAGPVRMSFADMAHVVLAHQQRDVAVIVDATATYFGVPIHETSLVPAGSAELGATTLPDWLSRQ